MFRKRGLPPVVVDPLLVKRAALVSTEELFSWADMSLNEAIKYFSAYRSQRVPELLEEAKMCVQGFSALLDEMSQRRPGVEPGRITKSRQPRGRVT